MKHIVRINLLIILILVVFDSKGQGDPISLNECHDLAIKNYPMVKGLELIKQSGEYSVNNARTGFFPMISLNGQYTYQSAVTEFPIELPNIPIPEINKDQYKIYAEVNQVLYDGGITRNKANAEKAKTDIEEKSLETDLYKVRERVNEIYFGILSIDRQIEQTKLLKQDIEAGLRKMEAAYANGTVLKSNIDAIRAESIKADQREIELRAARRAFLKMLSIFINKDLNEQTQLAIPAAVTVSNEIVRPELDLFEARMRGIDVQTSLIKSKNLPRLNLFVQGGYGSPGLNMLDPDADTWYIAGLRFSYPLNGFYTSKREKLINEISKKNISLQSETFIFNTNLQTARQLIEIEKIEELIKTDDEIVNLRDNVKQSSLSQLENGVITSADYIREVTAYDQAVQAKLLHEIQLLLAQYNYQLIMGNK